MTQTIRAHYDGRVIVPDEPVDVPVNQRLEVQLTPLPFDSEPVEAATIAERLRRFERFSGCVTGPSLPDEAFDREQLYDERL